jgi:beta-glucosidase/6-phospho-beta-glucosidase/beta-galactosidase
VTYEKFIPRFNCPDSDLRIPAPFFFGAATAGYQVEGGYNGAGQPQTNWGPWERAGHVETAGDACRFFDYAGADVATMARMGLNMFRMSIEWSRVQPSDRLDAHPDAPPPFDDAAIARYASIIASAQAAGMEPLVTLHHFVHPLWAGVDLWLDQDRAIPLFRNYIEYTVRALNSSLPRPVRYFITLNEVNLLAGASYAAGIFPHGAAGGVKASMSASAVLLAAHCVAYDTLHALYAQEGWEAPQVSLNLYSHGAYAMDRLFLDLLSARENGVAREDLHGHLKDARARWEDSMAAVPHPSRPWQWLRIGIERGAAGILARLSSLQRYAQAVDAIYSSPNPRKIDFLSIDYYDPFIRSQVGIPAKGQRWLRGRPNLMADLSELALNPAALVHFLRAYRHALPDKPILIAENGMCHRQGEERRDGATRDVYLQAMLHAVGGALAEGIPLLGYLHWSYCDNYEWGSYKPRFGLFRTDYAADARRHPLDAYGRNAAGAYTLLVAALRDGGARAIHEACTATSFPWVQPCAPGG